MYINRQKHNFQKPNNQHNKEKIWNLCRFKTNPFAFVACPIYSEICPINSEMLPIISEMCPIYSEIPCNKIRALPIAKSE